VTTWIHLTHPPRDNFAATMTDPEAEVFGEHFAYLRGLLDNGTLILAGPTLGPVDTGVAIFEAPDREAAEAIMTADPVVSSGLLTGDLREMRVSLLRGR
jgi:uncharacterized protein YciI